MKAMRDTTGQTMVEFALIFPIQLILVMFIVEMSLIMVGKSMVSYAAYCAAHAEILGQDPQEAASIALIPMGDATAPVMAQGQSQAALDSIPGWGYQPKWSDVRGKVKVYRLYNDDSQVLNRVDVTQTDNEYHTTNSVSMHNVAVEVEYPLEPMLPLSFFELFIPAESVANFQAVENQVLVNIDGQLYFVVRERYMLPNKIRAPWSNRLINTHLELRQTNQEYGYGQNQ